MKLLFILLIALFDRASIKTFVGGLALTSYANAQNYATGTNGIDNTWNLFETNSPTNIYGNRYNIWALNRDSVNFRNKRIFLDSIYKREDAVVSTGKFMWVNFPKREVKVSSFENFPLTVPQITNALGFMPSSPSGSGSLTAHQVTMALGYVPLQNEVDGSVTNELQTLSLNSGTLSLTDGGSVVLPTVDLSPYATNSYVNSTFKPIDYTPSASEVTAALGATPLFSEVDGSITNEIQTLSLNSGTLSLSNGGGDITLPTTDLSNHFTKTESDNRFLFKTDTSSLLVTKSAANGSFVTLWNMAANKIPDNANFTINGITRNYVNDNPMQWTLHTSSIMDDSDVYFSNDKARNAISVGVGLSYDATTGVITNTAIAITPTITAGTGISVNGSSPNFTVSSTVVTPTINAGSGISITGSSPNLTVSATAITPTINVGDGISVTGTWPNITISRSTATINSAVTRSLNTNFTVSARPAHVKYTIQCAVTNPLLIGTSAANAFLEYSTNGGSSWLTPATVANTSGVGITVTVQLTNSQLSVLSAYIPGGALVRIRTTTSGTANVTYVGGQEVIE